MLRSIILTLFVLITLTSSFAAAQEGSKSLSKKTPGSFSVHILTETWDSLRLGYKTEKSWPILMKIYKHTTVVEVTSLDIAKYDWVKQQITLTADATAVLKKRFKAGVKGSFPDLGTLHRAFVVTVDGEPAYGGVFLDRISPMAIKYPVIYINEDKNGLITMDVRPMHSYKLRASEPTWKVIQQERIHDFFVNAGKLMP